MSVLSVLLSKFGGSIMSSVLLKMIKLVVQVLSPEFKSFIVAQLPTWKEKAAATDNQWDDLVVDIVEALFGE